MVELFYIFLFVFAFFSGMTLATWLSIRDIEEIREESRQFEQACMEQLYFEREVNKLLIEKLRKES